MKKFWYVFAVVFAVLLSGCEQGPKHHHDDDDDDKPSGGGGGSSTKSELTPEGDRTLLWPALDTTTLQYGYINEKGEMEIQAQYQQAFGFSCGWARVDVNGAWTFVDKRGIPTQKDVSGMMSQYFYYNRCKFWRDGYYGMWDENFAEIIPAKYDQLGEPTADGLIWFAKYIEDQSTRYGYINLNGKVVLDPVYMSAGDYRDGMAAVGVLDTLTGITLAAVIDTKGNYIIEPSPLLVLPMGEGVLLGANIMDASFFLMTKDGTVLADGLKSAGTGFQDGLMLVQKADDQWYFLDAEGNSVLGPYYEARGFFNGVAWTKASATEPWKALDIDGQLLIELKDGVIPGTDFHNGLSLIKYVQPTFSQYWYLNKENKVVYNWDIDTGK